MCSAVQIHEFLQVISISLLARYGGPIERHYAKKTGPILKNLNRGTSLTSLSDQHTELNAKTAPVVIPVPSGFEPCPSPPQPSQNLTSRPSNSVITLTLAQGLNTSKRNNAINFLLLGCKSHSCGLAETPWATRAATPGVKIPPR